MRFDRSHADLEAMADVAVHIASPNQLQDLLLPGSDVAKWPRRGRWRGGNLFTEFPSFELRRCCSTFHSTGFSLAWAPFVLRRSCDSSGK